MEWYAKRRFGDLADTMAARYPDREALVFEDERYTFAELAQRIDEAAKGLMALGVERGDHVALWLNNSATWMIASFALAKIGAVQVPINTRFRTDDLAYVLGQSDSTMLITHDRFGPIDYLDIVRAVVDLPATDTRIADSRFPNLRQVVIVGSAAHDGTVSWTDAIHAGRTVSDEALRSRAATGDPDDPAFIMYTSGTTGNPKGVVHSHKLIRNVEVRGYRLCITPHDVILNYLPLFHAFGFSEGAMMSMITGAKQVVTATFDPEECLDLIERERATITHGFEAHLKGLTEAQEKRPRDISTLRIGLFAAGMHSATPVARRGAEVLAPMHNLSGYGMTEVWLGAAVGGLGDTLEQRCETSGYPGLGYELRIVDPETGADQPANAPGELLVRGDSLMLGYYNKPEETAASFDKDGWFRTGDTAMLRDDGYLRFLGRYKDMLKVGGENVDPMEVEGMLLEHPSVHQVAIVGAPDDRLTEVPVAFVEAMPDAEMDAESVIGFCRGKVANFKIPKHVVFIDEFPMTASGKIRKVDLRKEAKRLFAPHAESARTELPSAEDA
ncbi:MAG: AMP-binding protein [Alphaproteobacteria bacterium]|nr:AMP-binding protein [Alphaproteobacteria bacterium]